MKDEKAHDEMMVVKMKISFIKMKKIKVEKYFGRFNSAKSFQVWNSSWTKTLDLKNMPWMCGRVYFKANSCTLSLVSQNTFHGKIQHCCPSRETCIRTHYWENEIEREIKRRVKEPSIRWDLNPQPLDRKAYVLLSLYYVQPILRLSPITNFLQRTIK